jgi:hypothetical protein
MLQQMQSGALDMGWIMAAELGSRVPTIAAITRPTWSNSTPKIAKLVRDPSAMKLFDVLPRETGTVGLAWGITGMRAVFAKGHLQGRRHPRHEAAHQPDAGVSRLLPAARRRPDADPDAAGLRRHDQRPGRRARSRSRVLLEPALRQAVEVDPADERVFMPVIALVSGRVWQTISPADRELITKT